MQKTISRILKKHVLLVQNNLKGKKNLLRDQSNEKNEETKEESEKSTKNKRKSRRISLDINNLNKTRQLEDLFLSECWEEDFFQRLKDSNTLEEIVEILKEKISLPKNGANQIAYDMSCCWKKDGPRRIKVMNNNKND